MKAIVLKGPNDFSLQDIEDPAPTADSVEIKVHLIGICGTDLTILRGKNPNVPYPLIPGHECVGEVLRAPAHTKFRTGDRITVFPAYGCRKCAACGSGHIPRCPEAKTVGVLRPDGYFTERILAHPERVFLLPEQMEDAVGAMVEPTAVAVHANRRASLENGAKVVVIGGGTIGLLTAQIARAYGAASVIVSEPVAERRSLAEKLGIERTCDPRQENLAELVRDTIGLADAVFDVVGSETTVRQSVEMLRPDGLLVLVALPKGTGPGIPYQQVFQKELRVAGSRTYYMDDFPEAIRLLSDQSVQVKPLISQILPLSRFTEAVELLEKHPEKYVKILVNPLE